MIVLYKIQLYSKIFPQLIFKNDLDIEFFSQQYAYLDTYRIGTIVSRCVSYRDISVSLQPYLTWL